MNQQPDKLFREKLANHQMPAPPTAWDRVEHNLHRTKHARVWLRLAASLTLFAAAGVVLLNYPWSTDSAVSIHIERDADKQLPDRQQARADSNATSASSPSADMPPVVAPAKRPSSLPPVPTDVKETAAFDKTDTLTRDEQTIPRIEILLEVIVADAATETRAGSDRPDDDASPESQDRSERVTIVYTTEDVEKYFNRNENTEATPEDQKTSTLKKLLARAYDLKNDQDAYGELRQRKNEIFAFNLKGDKQRSENK